METAQISPDQSPDSEKLDIEKKSKVLIKKFGLTDSIPNPGEVIETSKNIAEKYKVPESFLKDEVNLSLLLGCSQKLIESTDPIYRKRSENLVKRLVAPSAGKETINVEELWGTEPERAGLDETQKKEYVRSKTDPEATAQFQEKYKDAIIKAREVWKVKGYDLNLNISIVSDDVYEFRSKTRSGGYINVPDKEELPKEGGPVTVDFVLLKGYSDKENIIKHELYHVEDFWGYQRRGYQGSVLEGLDELFTEYSAGNYNENHSSDQFSDSSYFTLKQFWDELSYTGDLDFNLLKDRKETVDAIIKNFGFDGFVDFTLMHAHGDGRFSIFETFYNNPERPIIDMLISKEKLNLRGLKDTQNLSVEVSDSINLLKNLKGYLKPSEGSWLQKYRSIYDLIPSKEGRVYGASPIPERGGTIQLENNEAKDAINAYARALAFADLCYRGEIKEQTDLYNKTIEALAEIPYKRPGPDSDVGDHIKKEYDRGKEYANNDDELYQDIYRDLYQNLVYEMKGIDFVFSLQNPVTRDQILKPFLGELDLLAKYCLESGNKDFIKWFVDGLYKFNMALELREVSVQHLTENYSEFKPVIEARRVNFDARKVANFSF